MTFAQPFSDYEILEKIGSGAMGTVFKARQKRLERIVALKVLRPTLARNSRYVERLRREAQIVAKLNHPNIVAGYDLGEEGGYHFFVMEFVEGESLRHLLAEWGSFPEDQVLSVALQVASALDHAFQAGVIHRDIKPGNILIDSSNRVKLTDMGLAKGPTDMTLTREGATVGTPQYISPEQARNPQDVDVRTDLYSLGATLFHMITGQPPFRGETIGELITKVLHDPEPYARDVDPQIGEGLSLVIRKLMCRNLRLRYQDPAELLADLERVERSERPAVDLHRIERSARRRRPVPTAVGVAGLLLLSLLVVWLVVPMGGSEGDDGRAAAAQGVAEQFRSDLRTALSKRSNHRQKLTLLEEWSRRPAGAGQDDWLTERRADLISSLQVEAATFLDGFLDDRVQAWLQEPEQWRNGAGSFSRRLASEFSRRFGYRPDTLPAGAAASLEPALERLREDVRQLLAARDSAYLERVRGFLDGELQPRVEELQARQDFAGALELAQTQIDGFHGEEGRPRRADLSDRLRAQVDGAERQWLTALRTQVDALQERTRQLMLQYLSEDSARVEELLAAGGDWSAARRQFESVFTRYESRFPASTAFTGEYDPWPELRTVRELLQDRLDARSTAASAALLEESLLDAYRALLVEGSAEAMAAYVEELELQTPEQEDVRARHLELLDSATRLRDAFLEALSDRPTAILTTARSGGPEELQVERLQGRLTLTRRSERERFVPVRLLDVRFSRLWRRRTPDALRERAEREEPRGLAFWLFADGELNRAFELLATDASDREFFQRALKPLVETLRGEQASLETAAHEALVTLREERSATELDRLQQSLTRFERDFGSTRVAQTNRGTLREMKAWVRDESGRRAVEVSLREQAPAGVQVAVDSDRRATFDYHGDALLKMRAPDSWDRSAGHWQLQELAAEGGIPRAAAVQQRLVLRSPVPAEADVEAEFLLSLDLERGAAPQLIALELHGVHVVVVVLPVDGRVLAFADNRDLLAHADWIEDAVRQRIGDLREAEAHWTDGALQSLRIALERGPSQARVRITLEDRLLWDERSELPAQLETSGPRIAVTGMQALGWHGLRLISDV